MNYVPDLLTERDAMGCDEYHPLTKKGSNLTDAGGIGYTVVDAIDTMQLMGLEEEYQRARHWISTKMTFERDGNFNTFEVRLMRLMSGSTSLTLAYLTDNHSRTRWPALRLSSLRRG